MTNGLRWGILGAGGIARSQTADLLLAGHAVTAVGARDLGKAREFAAEFGIPNAHGSYADLVADPDVDVVYVATLHPFHAEHATLALEAGKHVLLEKPFTMDAAEARAVTDLAAAKGLVVLEAMWTRYLPHMVRIREILAAGLLGEIRTVTADHDQKIDHIPRLVRPELGGGALLDLGIYPISLAWDLLGEPAAITAKAVLTNDGIDRQTAVVFEYASGAQAVLQFQLDARGPNRAAIVGTEGRIEIEDTWYALTTFHRFDATNELVETFVTDVPGRGMQFQAAELERLVAAGELGNDILPPEQTVAIMGTLDAIRGQIGLEYPPKG